MFEIEGKPSVRRCRDDTSLELLIKTYLRDASNKYCFPLTNVIIPLQSLSSQMLSTQYSIFNVYTRMDQKVFLIVSSV